MKWALIAGGSKGIGFSIAESLAKRSYNLVLVARNQEDLVFAKENLEKKFSISIEIFPCDLALADTANKISEWCATRDLEINILCNAAGMGGSKDFPDLPQNDLRSMIRLNLESAVTLTSSMFHILKKNAPSYIMNIGSMAGFAPIPIKSVYASTKSALHSFSHSLKYLLESENISVSCLCPGPVFTKPSIEEETIYQLGWLGRHMSLRPEVVGELAVRGMFAHKMIIIPGKLATLISCLLRILPDRFLTWISYSFRKKNRKNSSPTNSN